MRYSRKLQKHQPAVKRTARSLFVSCCFVVPLLVSFCNPSLAAISTPPPVSNSRLIANPEALTRLPSLIERDLHEGNIPGAVVVIGQAGAGQPNQILFQQSFGSRALLPDVEAMTDDTIFDIASLTKVIATTTAILQLIEQNKLQLDAPVARYWPAFANNGKGNITLRQLLTHYSGLRPDIPMSKSWQGYAAAMKLIENEKPAQTPGSTYVYSDINFEALGELVRRISGESLAEYCERHIFAPLNMHQTRFLPPASWRDHIAPTLYGEEIKLRGEVHDPAARRMGGVAGHAGLFSTASDLSRFARMLLGDGTLDGAQILKHETIQLMRAPQSPIGTQPFGKEKLRGLGWDLAAPFAANRLALPTLGTFGHTGYTGTSLWIDPVSGLYSIILTNRVHPDDRAKIQTLRDDIATAIGDAAGPITEHEIAELFASTPLPSKPLLDLPTSVITGLDVLEDLHFAPLAGKRVGLITNHTGRDHDGNSTVDLFKKSKTIKLVALFSPEHGLEGMQDERVDSRIDTNSQIPIYSLYGKTLRPTPEMLKDIDVLVFDIQDAGARFYTYISTMGYSMEAAAAAGIDFYVLDRPNPIGAHRVQGPLLDDDLKSFTGYFALPVSHGMTTGELARLFNIENHINARLRVLPMRGYRRDLWFDQTGLNWINPSPNLRSLTAATLYPGVAIVEGANVSVGRGTDKPFEVFGAPWIDGVELSRYLHKRAIEGLSFQAAEFTPSSGLYQGKLCHGVTITVTDREQLDAPLLGIEIASALQHLHPKRFDLKSTTGMIGSRVVVDAIKRGDDPRAIAKSWVVAHNDFLQMRHKYLLYPIN